MRLATLHRHDGPRAVVLREDRALTVDGFADVGELLRSGPEALQAARRTLESGEEGQVYAEADLLRPVLQPGAVVCVGLNYRSHILEMGRELPKAPTLFSKLPRALTDPAADVNLPGPGSFDYEGEICAVIGTPGRDIQAGDAWQHVAGLTVCNDVTDRDAQWRTSQWFAGKTLEAATPVGPCVVTLDELEDLDAVELRVAVNGEQRQQALMGDLLFDIPALVADVSRFVTLQPGDLIATGTPGGVGHGSKRYLNDGDVVEVSVSGVGTLRNRFHHAP